jgi:hypothetical protein
LADGHHIQHLCLDRDSDVEKQPAGRQTKDGESRQTPKAGSGHPADNWEPPVPIILTIRSQSLLVGCLPQKDREELRARTNASATGRGSKVECREPRPKQEPAEGDRAVSDVRRLLLSCDRPMGCGSFRMVDW